MNKWLSGSLILALLVAVAYGGWMMGRWTDTKNKDTEVLTREGVLMKIDALNRLESTAFYIDTIVRSEKKGNWFVLWQDNQKGLFLAKGRVLAGLDLDKLKPDDINVVDDKVIISLPPVEILSVDLDNLEVYDLRTGTLGLPVTDHSVLNQVQAEAKQQVLQSACKADILAHAQNQSQQQLETLFALTQTAVSIYPAALAACKFPV